MICCSPGQFFLFSIPYDNIRYLSYCFFNIKKMKEMVISVFMILGTLLYYFIYYKPKKLISRYSKEFKSKGFKVFQYPYKPFGFPIIQLTLKDSKEGDAFKTLKSEWVNYDLVISNFFTTPSIVFLSPRARKQFAKNENQYNYIKLPKILALKAKLVGLGLVFSEGEVWKRKRRIISSMFTHEFVSAHIHDIEIICERALNELEVGSKISSAEVDGDIFKYDLLELTVKMFSDVILSIYLGFDSTNQIILGRRAGDFILKLANDCNQQVNSLLPLLFGPSVLQLGLRKLDRDINHRIKVLNDWANTYCSKILQSNFQESATAKTILSLMKEKGNGSQQTQTLSKYELVQDLKTFFLAGSETTSHWLQMMIYYIGKNPQIEKKVRLEIEENIKDGKCTLENLKKLKYIQAVQKQTTRIYGPINFNITRSVIKDHYFSGVLLEKGTIVQYNAIPTHFNPVYYPDPFDFKPERWLDQVKSIDSSLLTGFSIGSRSCLGQILARLESKIGLVKFLHRYPKFTVPKQNLNMKWRFLYMADDFDVEVMRK